MSGGGYTRVGCLFTKWAPYRLMDHATRCLWFGIYTGSTTKRLVPGLFEGDLPEIASAACMQPDDTIRSLDALLERDLIEFDHYNKVLRLTELPDAGEWPSNPSILRSWWSRFRTVTDCAVRNAHVTTIRWLLDKGAAESDKNRSGKPTAAHEEIWVETFGRVQIPVVRKRGKRRLLDHDTSTDHQPGLFPSKPPETPSPDGSYPQGDNDPSLILDSRKIRDVDTLSTGDGEGEGEGEGVFRSVPESGALSAAGEIANRRPVLTLVPPAHVPFTVEQLLGILNNQGLKVSESERCALQDAINLVDDIPEGEDTLALLKGWRRMAVLELVVPGSLRTEIARARARKQQADEQMAMMRAAREKAGV